MQHIDSIWRPYDPHACTQEDNCNAVCRGEHSWHYSQQHIKAEKEDVWHEAQEALDWWQWEDIEKWWQEIMWKDKERTQDVQWKEVGGRHGPA